VEVGRKFVVSYIDNTVRTARDRLSTECVVVVVHFARHLPLHCRLCNRLDEL